MTQDFGRTISCTTDIDPMGRVVTGSRVMVELVVRMITTPKGSLLSNPEWGIDVREWVNDAMTDAEIASLAGRVRATLLQDERISSADVSTLWLSTSHTLRMRIQCEAAAGPFDLTVDITKASVALVNPG